MTYGAKKLIKALRSGEYRQTQGRLGRIHGDGSTSYCCLGVACEVYAKTHKNFQIEPLRYDSYDIFKTYGPKKDRYGLPDEVKKWLGFKDSSGGFGKDGSLIDLNDSGKTFAEIADVIESEPEGLFKNE